MCCWGLNGLCTVNTNCQNATLQRKADTEFQTVSLHIKSNSSEHLLLTEEEEEEMPPAATAAAGGL